MIVLRNLEKLYSIVKMVFVKEVNMFYNELRFAIVKQAADDLIDLVRCNADTCTLNYSTYTLNELREFFDSEWCDFLLSGSDITGEEIFKEVVKRYANTGRNAKRKKQACKKLI